MAVSMPWKVLAKGRSRSALAAMLVAACLAGEPAFAQPQPQPPPRFTLIMPNGQQHPLESLDECLCLLDGMAAAERRRTWLVVHAVPATLRDWSPYELATVHTLGVRVRTDARRISASRPITWADVFTHEPVRELDLAAAPWLPPAALGMRPLVLLLDYLGFDLRIAPAWARGDFVTTEIVPRDTPRGRFTGMNVLNVRLLRLEEFMQLVATQVMTVYLALVEPAAAALAAPAAALPAAPAAPAVPPAQPAPPGVQQGALALALQSPPRPRLPPLRLQGPASLPRGPDGGFGKP
jgi:hypothetical protein